MIVCHCEVVNDKQVKHALEQGARTVAQVCNTTGAGRNCGSCIFSLKRIIHEHDCGAGEAVAEVEALEGAAS